MPVIFAWAFASALTVSLLTTPFARWLARTTRVLDRPGGRKIHRSARPLLGGISIFASTVGPLLFLHAIGAEAVTQQMPALAWLVGALGAVGILAVGILDDVKGLKPPPKLALQLLVATGVVVAGPIRFDAISIPGSEISLGVLAAPAAILWIVLLVNAWNLLDGMDGLAAGVAMIAAFALGVRAATAGQIAQACLFFGMAGGCAGFLRHNFHPATIFMGDCGSMFLGYAFAVGTLIPGPVMEAGRTTVPLDIPLLVFAIPVVDSAAAVLRRLLLYIRMRRVWSRSIGDGLRLIARADNRHIHHGLLRQGWNQRRSALAVYVAAAALGAVDLLFDRLTTVAGWVAMGATLCVAVCLTYALGCFSYASIPLSLARKPGSDEESREAIAPAASWPRADEDSERAGAGKAA